MGWAELDHACQKRIFVALISLLPNFVSLGEDLACRLVHPCGSYFEDSEG